jgi:hypothetical protein
MQQEWQIKIRILITKKKNTKIAYQNKYIFVSQKFYSGCVLIGSHIIQCKSVVNYTKKKSQRNIQLLVMPKLTGKNVGCNRDRKG